MLHLVVGIAHSKKSRLIFENIEQLSAAGKSCVLLVPEQASFINEKAVSKINNPSQVSVVSFTRLSELLLLQLGGAKPVLDDVAAHMLMCVALQEVKDLLVLYRNKHKSRGFIAQIADFAAECENAGITPENLSASAQSLPFGGLRDKAAEAALILNAYEGLVAQSGMSLADAVSLAATRLRDGDIFKDVHVFIDDFSGFTAPEWKMVEALMAVCPDMTVSLCCDEIDSQRPSFALTVQTAQRLGRIAEKLGADIKVTSLPPDPNRPKGLAALEDGLDRFSLPDCGDGEGVVCHAAQNVRDELETVAASIAALVCQEGCRYRDIAVISNNPERYLAILPIVFSAYNIPYFIDLPKDARSCVLSKGLLDAVALAADEGGEWLRYIKSPILGLDAKLVGEVENYCYVWSVDEKQWLQPFANHPDGFKDPSDNGQPNDEAVSRLIPIEQCRAGVVAPVLRLRDAFSKKTGLSVAQGAYAFLSDISAPQHLAAFALDLKQSEQTVFLEEQSMLWDQIMQVLDRFALLPEDIMLDGGQIAELFELSLGTMKVSTPPQTLDQTAVGTAKRMRPENPAAVFLLGAIEGEFPAVSDLAGLFSAYERSILAQQGLEELENNDSARRMECAVVYRAATAASRVVTVTCPARELSGEPLMPSSLFETAKAVAKSGASSDAVLSRVWTAASLAWELARTGTQNTEQAQTLQCLAKHFPDERRLDAIKRSLVAKDHRLTLPQASRGLLGKRIKLSATRLESYYRCPFSFFVKDGLKFVPLRKAELTVAEAGTLMHYILAVMLDRYRGSALTQLTDAQLKTDIRQIINDYIGRRVKNLASLSARMRYNFLRQEEWAFELIDRLRAELKQSAFVPVAFELAIGEGKAIESPVYKTPEGEEIILQGSIDRVDIAEINNRRYVRVVDYKSGGKEFYLSDLCSGLNMQMLLYLFAVCKNGKGDFKNLLPAGVVYLPTLGKYFSAERSIAEDKLESEKNKHYKTSGLLLDDEEVLKGMGPMYDRFTAKKSKHAGADALVSHSEMKKVEELVARRVVQMAQGFLTGEISALPTEQKGKRACEYCDYRAVCGFEEGDPVRSIDVLERSAVFGEVMIDE